MYQKWPNKTFPIVNFIFSHDGHEGPGAGGSSDGSRAIPVGHTQGHPLPHPRSCCPAHVRPVPCLIPRAPGATAYLPCVGHRALPDLCGAGPAAGACTSHRRPEQSPEPEVWRRWSETRPVVRSRVGPRTAASCPETPIACNRYPRCDVGCWFFTGLWTVTRSSLRMLRRVAALIQRLRPEPLLVSFPRSRSPGAGVPFARQRRRVVGVLRLCWLLPGSFDCFWGPRASVHRPSVACLAVFPRA